MYLDFVSSCTQTQLITGTGLFTSLGVECDSLITATGLVTKLFEQLGN